MIQYAHEKWTFTGHTHMSKHAHNTTQRYKIHTETYTRIAAQYAHAVHGSNTIVTRKNQIKTHTEPGYTF